MKMKNKKKKVSFENPDGFIYSEIITDKENQPIDSLLLEVNPTFEELCEVSRDELIKKKFSELTRKLRILDPEWINIFGRVAMSGESEKFEFYSKFHKRWFVVSVNSPKRSYFSASFSDITDTKELDELYKKAQIYSEYFSKGKDLVLVCSYTEKGGIGSIIEINQNFCYNVNYPKRELLTMNFEDVLTLKRTSDEKKIKENFEEKGRAVFDAIMRTEDGLNINVDCDSYLFEYDDEPTVMVIVRKPEPKGYNPEENTYFANRERKKIIQMLELYDWNITKAAEEMGVHRTTLWRKMKLYKLK